MSVSFDFWKMHGAGNDFILLDDRENRFLSDQADRIAALAQRRTGVGSEGVVLLTNPTEPGAHVRMRFFNPDGSEVDMCGTQHDAWLASPSKSTRRRPP